MKCTDIKLPAFHYLRLNHSLPLHEGIAEERFTSGRRRGGGGCLRDRISPPAFKSSNNSIENGFYIEIIAFATDEKHKIINLAPKRLIHLLNRIYSSNIRASLTTSGWKTKSNCSIQELPHPPEIQFQTEISAISFFCGGITWPRPLSVE